MRPSPVLLVLVACVLVGGGVAIGVATQETACERLRSLQDEQFDSFAEDQAAKAKATAECMLEESRNGR
jgi:hypothetical protein